MPTRGCSLPGLFLAILAAAQILLSAYLRTSAPSLPSNLITGGDLLANRNFEFECDGDKYGDLPNIADCEAARHLIPPDLDQYAFGERHTGLEGVYPLPFLLMGGKSPDY